MYGMIQKFSVGFLRRSRYKFWPTPRNIEAICTCEDGSTLHYSTLHYSTLHYSTLQYITLQYITLQYITLQYITVHYITVHYITVHYITVHYITLQYITLHYITLQYITFPNIMIAINCASGRIHKPVHCRCLIVVNRTPDNLPWCSNSLSYIQHFPSFVFEAA